MVAKHIIDKYGDILADKNQPLKRRFRALFALKSFNGPDAVEAIGKCFDDSSALLKHELAYCLGQMADKSAIPVLTEVLKDENQEPMVRHEAGEALGAIGDLKCLGILESLVNDPVVEVSQTCELAMQRVKGLATKKEDFIYKNIYSSIDPTPATSDTIDIENLRQILIDEKRTLWDRYRAMFRLRDLNTDESVTALAEGLSCEDSALFRHEVAFVLGQLQHPLTIPQLVRRLENRSESGMVRHECAEALGAIGTPECRQILTKFLLDPERVVRESCEVALDIADYNENDQQLQYADVV